MLHRLHRPAMQGFNKEKEKITRKTIKNIAKQSNSFILSPCSIRRFDMTSVRHGGGLLSFGFFVDSIVRQQPPWGSGNIVAFPWALSGLIVFGSSIWHHVHAACNPGRGSILAYEENENRQQAHDSHRVICF